MDERPSALPVLLGYDPLLPCSVLWLIRKNTKALMAYVRHTIPLTTYTFFCTDAIDLGTPGCAAPKRARTEPEQHADDTPGAPSTSLPGVYILCLVPAVSAILPQSLLHSLWMYA